MNDEQDDIESTGRRNDYLMMGKRRSTRFDSRQLFILSFFFVYGSFRDFVAEKRNTILMEKGEKKLAACE